LVKTALSIREQTYKNIQWIIADGLSSDGTLDVVNENQDIVTKYFSTQDDGIYDAWNKACKFIDGDWTIFLGAGDTFQTPYTLDLCCSKILSVPDNYNFAFGNISVIGENKCYEITYEGEFISKWIDLNYSTPPHSSTFTRSSILKSNSFDIRFKIIGDRKFMVSHSAGKYFNLKTYVTVMDGFGISNDTKNIPLIWKENIMLSKSGYRAPMRHRVKAYIANYRNVFLVYFLGSDRYNKWIKK
jgi:glycosyltransferase involved in cell wall biosynthesis